MKDFSKGSNVSFQIKHAMMRALRIRNNSKILRKCTEKSPLKETIDRAVVCGFLTVVNTSLADIQYDCSSKTYVYELVPTEEGLLYLKFQML